MSISRVTELKIQGNKLYSDGNAIFPDDDCLKYFRQACVVYGQAIEEALAVEARHEQGYQDVSFSILKATLFLNLATSNLKLGSYEGCRRCCNTCLYLCNNPSLLLGDIGVEEDVTIDVQPILPVDESRVKLIVKAVFRRGRCHLETGNVQNALADAELAHSLQPNDKEIKILLDHAKSAVTACEAKESHDTSSNTLHKRLDGLKDISMSDISYMTVNGGPCLSRIGFWSQSVKEATVYIPVKAISDETQCRAINWNICFEQKQIEIMYRDKLLTVETLEYFIDPTKSTWTLEEFSNCIFLVLYISKAPSREWFPGCEWWDRVFDNDEPIDTMTCSVGTEINELPEQARQRAYKEHDRFCKLDQGEQEEELQNIKSLKKEFIEAESRTRLEAEREDEAIKEVPERSQIQYLRNQFPNIEFKFG